MDSKRKLIEMFLEKEILLSPEFVEHLEKADEARVRSVLDAMSSKNGMLVMNSKVQELIEKDSELNWEDFEKLCAGFQKKDDENSYEKALSAVRSDLSRPKKDRPFVSVRFSYEENDEKKSVQSFISVFNKRYSAIKSILQNRQELDKASAISRVKMRDSKDKVAVIGMVSEINHSKSGNVILKLEDPSGEINVVVSKSKPELSSAVKNVVLDEVLAITGTGGQGIIFADSIIFPDIPINHEMKRCQDDVSLAVIGDIHMGSKHFLYDDFNKMIKWLKGEFGTESQREEAKRIKYLFLIGDLVDGVGIYPSQEKDLDMPDIREQYSALANYVRKIPKDINIIICAGNHDAVRIAEPQPPIPKDYAPELWEMDNVTMVSNPSVVTIGASEDFPGFDVLLYHGFSFPYYADTVEPIRSEGGLKRVDLILKFLMQKRHLAPSHTSTQYIPDERDDFLVIRTVPDFFITGHIHRTSIDNYKNVTMINGSTWLGMTDFQEKVGLKPLPSRVPIINLKTRKAKILRF